MWRGTLISALGHAALVGLALELPWLRAGGREAVPAVMVELVDPARLATRRAPAPSREELLEAPETPVRAPPAAGPQTEGIDPQPGATEATLAPFDPDGPLGLGGPAAPAAPWSATSGRPRPRASSGGEAVVTALPAADPALLQSRYWRAVQAAVTRARPELPGVRARGVVGMTRVELTVGRDGRLLEARLLRSSGSTTIDQASLDAALAAELPAAPTALGGDSFTFAVDLFFGLDRN